MAAAVVMVVVVVVVATANSGCRNINLKESEL